MSSCTRRLTNEINMDWNDSSLNNYVFLENLNTVLLNWDKINENIMFYLLFNNKYSCIITCNFKGNSYPFKPPKIMINNQYQYKNLIAMRTSSEKWKKKFNFEKCPCCESILCKLKPSCRLKDIISEIRKNLTNKLRIVEILHAKVIVRKKLNINYVPIEEFL